MAQDNKASSFRVKSAGIEASTGEGGQRLSMAINPLTLSLMGGAAGAGIGGLYGMTHKDGEREIPRRAARGALTGGAAGLGTGVGAIGGGLGGATLGGLLGAAVSRGRPDAIAGGIGLGGIAGGAAGGVAGGVLAGHKAHEMTDHDKKADDLSGFANAVHQTQANNLQGDALNDVKHLALATLGLGGAMRGGIGLYNMAKRSRPKRKVSPLLSMPYPVAEKAGGFLGGDAATTKAGIPWYGPAMMMAGIGGIGAGWKGVDHVLNKRRERERGNDLSDARQQFHDALMSQYDAPLTGTPPTASKTASDSTMVKVGEDLDKLYDNFEKAAITLGDAAGQGLGMYGMYAAPAALMTGALVYDKARKRQRRAVLDKAIQRRDRRKFNVSPPEITAVPQPFHPPTPAPTEAPEPTE